METIRGYVEKITYSNETNSYTVLTLVEKDRERTVVGAFLRVAEGMNLEITGQIDSHPVYGEQFSMKEYKELPMEDEISMKRYLSSGAIKGIGESLANRIVKAFGGDTFRVIDEEPERLIEIKGISRRIAMEISSQLEEKKEAREAFIYLQKFGITNTMAYKIYMQYGNAIYSIMDNNPYKLAEDIEGIGFQRADEIAQRAGIFVDSEYRIRSGITYTLLQAANFGHTYLPEDRLINKTATILGVREEDIVPHIDNLAMDKKIIIRNEEKTKEEIAQEKTEKSQVDEFKNTRKIYAISLYYTELNAAKMLEQLNISTVLTQEEVSIIEQKTENILAEQVADGGYELDILQKNAVVESIQNGLFILTGGPGTGKTTVINSIIKYFFQEGKNIVLAAPTGRAAKRMTQATGYEAKTIHRLLEVSGLSMEEGNGDKKPFFGRNEENPLEADVVIVDEMSMVDIYLFSALLKAITIGTRLIMVGDVDQLPSVGPGQVLRDLIASTKIQVVSLKKIFRQGEKSLIVENAHRINRGEDIQVEQGSKDFFFVKRQNAEQITKDLVILMKDKIPRNLHIEPFDIQVLTPMKEGALGVHMLNMYIQNALNPKEKGKEETIFENTCFRLNDKVMQVKNNYRIEWEILGNYNIPIDAGLGVFNGDMGIVQSVNTYTKELVVEYEEHKRVTYPFHQLSQLELAYAITIHKSQGSEYPAVLMPLLGGPKNLYNRNLLYTGFTRARDCLLVLGDREVIRGMIDNAKVRGRFTSLHDFMNMEEETTWK